MTTESILEALGSDALDAAIIASDEAVLGFRERPLYRELSSRTSVSPRRAASWLPADDVWLLSEGHRFRDQVLQACGDRGVRQGWSGRWRSETRSPEGPGQ